MGWGYDGSLAVGGGGGSSAIAAFPRASLADVGDFTVTAFGATDGVCTLAAVTEGGLKLKAANGLTDHSFARITLPAAVAGTGQTYCANMVLGSADRHSLTRTFSLGLCAVIGTLDNTGHWYMGGVHSTLDGIDDLEYGSHHVAGWANAPTSQVGGRSQSLTFRLYFHRYRSGGATWTVRLLAEEQDGIIFPVGDDITTDVDGDAGLLGVRYKNASGTDEEFVIITEFGTVDMSDYTELFPAGS